MDRLLEDLDLARANFQACAYNVVVNLGTSRGERKLADLVVALNAFKRAEGRAKMQALVEKGVIESYAPCALECCVRPGGLFHVEGCENDSNHPVSKARAAKAREMLTHGTATGIHDGYWDANVTLVG